MSLIYGVYNIMMFNVTHESFISLPTNTAIQWEMNFKLV